MSLPLLPKSTATPTEDTQSDSAYADSIIHSTSSLTSSIVNYTYENGRRYHAFRDGEYPLPNDEKEQDRLDLFHHIYKLLLNGDLFCAPIPPNPQRVLDFGTGTGIWALDIADQFTSAEVIGTDLSPIQPQWVAPNCTFEIDDIESEWTFGRPFNFIHSRNMGGSIRDWDKLYAKIYQHLQPGGYAEIQEFETWVVSDDDIELKNAPNVLRMLQEVAKASENFGKELNIAPKVKQGMIDAGFEDVTDKVYKVHLNETFSSLLCWLIILSILPAPSRPIAKRSPTEGDRNVPTLADARRY
ncbi:hypothetical protein BP6252_07516 [Coleophoma cylindrospora]|uniref:Uncharacterized protein n=1 Tax=Coleophoma cylindrospora TaxID=1849047 RepID=A0A3D8RA77_9HELO|nr:hypothetical protein BP6252_07516 [Coleophoma cylindrospora]